MLEDIDRAITDIEVSGDIERLPESDRAQWIGLFGKLFHAPIVGVRKLGKVRGIYEFVLADGSTIELGTAGNVRRQSAVIDAIADARAKIPTTLKPYDWVKVAEAILRSAEVEDLGSSSEDEMQAWLSVVVRRVSVLELSPAKTAEMLSGDLSPLYRSADGALLVHVTSLLAAILLHCNQRITLQDATRRLRRLGFRAVQVGARAGKSTLAKRFWQSPRAFEV